MTREELLKDLELSEKATLETLPLNKSRSWAMSEQKDWAWIAEIEKEAKQTMATMYAMHEEGSKFWGKSQKPRVLNELKLLSAVREMKAALEGIQSLSNKCLLGSCCVSETCERSECEVQSKSNSAYGQAADIANEALARLAKGDL